jgi:NAD(P)H-hydrate epimerase
VVVTPHPGEMARLVGESSSWIQQHRAEIARSFAKDWNVVTVLKGARSLIADQSGRLCINPTGNPGMASGGMGDVLTGMIGGLLAQQVDPFDAARLATFLHGAAGDMASTEVGPIGYLASELMNRIPTLLGTFSIV